MDLQEQLTKHLTDVHSIEEQALQQMLVAPRMARDPELARAFREHLDETREQERRVRERLSARGDDPSRVKDLAGRAGGIGMVLFARTQPDTPGKLVAHAYSYEHMEMAAYDLLALVAERAGDSETAETGALDPRAGGRDGASASSSGFDRAVEASLREVDPVGPRRAARHAICRTLTRSSPSRFSCWRRRRALAGDSNLRKAFEEHLEETRAQQAAVEARLEARGARPSRFKSVLLRVGGVNLGGFFAVQPDTPAKLAGFAFAFEHLEVAAYELLRRVAERAGDDETARIAERIAGEERAAAAAVRSCFDEAVDAALVAQGAA